MSYVYPTHHCFDDAVEFCERRARAKHPSVATTLRLVHGIILTPADQPAGASDTQPGERAVHAWVEDGDLCWDAGILEDGRHIEFAVEKAEYYAHYRVQETTVYTMWQVLWENKASGHYGPWRPEYRALCRRRTDGETRDRVVRGEVSAARRDDQSALAPESAARRRR